MSEGGIGWVPMLIDRLENVVDRSGYGRGWDLRPAEILRRNFYFCTIDDPSTIDLYDVIGEDHIMVEVDYPHGDSTWPDTQAELKKACLKSKRSGPLSSSSAWHAFHLRELYCSQPISKSGLIRNGSKKFKLF